MLKKKLTIFVIILFTLGFIFGCTSSPNSSGEKPTIGLSISDHYTERWINEENMMRDLLSDLGYQVVSAQADYDINRQISQIEEMIDQNVSALIVVAVNSEAIVPVIEKATEAGILVIAYDTLIKTDSIAAYVTFDNIEAGRLQAQGIMDALDIQNRDIEAEGPARIVILGGHKGDNNAHLFRLGQQEILSPFIDAGKIEIVGDEWILNWEAVNAVVQMQSILIATNKNIDGIVASNDDIALGALDVLREYGLAGSVPISGQDATIAGCNSIARGELTLTVLKDYRELAPAAVLLTDQLLSGEVEMILENRSLAELTLNDSLLGNVECIFLPVVQINAQNLHALVVESGFQNYEDIYFEVPEEKRP